MRTYDDALEIIRNLNLPALTFDLPLTDALHHTLAGDIHAPRPAPYFRNSSMDGIGLQHSDLEKGTTLHIFAIVHAGPCPQPPAYRPSGCIRIMTGGFLPEWVDTVVPVEHLSFLGGHKVKINTAPTKGMFVREIAEDLSEGALLLAKGTVLNAEHVMVLAGFGIETVPVFTPPKVGLFCSGDELAEPGTPLRPGMIFNSSKYFLQAALQSEGITLETYRTMTDDPTTSEQVIHNFINTPEPRLILTTGAVSAGEKDFIPQLAEKLGFKILMHKVAIRPGKPVLLAQKNSTFWLALPGNAISTAVGWHFFARPLLRQWARRPSLTKAQFPLAHDVVKPEGLRAFFRAQVANGKIFVEKRQASSHFLASLATNAYIELTEPYSLVPQGTLVDVTFV